MKIKIFLSAIFAAAILTTSTYAQGMFGRPVIPNEQLAKLFGKSTAFSADASITVNEPSSKSRPEMQMSFAMLDGKVRTEIDMTKMGGNLPPEAVAHMKQMGMGRTVTIFLPAKNVLYMIYPGMKSYCDITPPNATAATAAGKELKIEKTTLGHETIEDHDCTKVKVTGTEENGRTFEWLMWQAADLKEFPVKIEMTAEKGTMITILYRNINQNKPDAALFIPPSDFTRYGSMQEMMMGAMGAGRGMPSRGSSE